MSLERVITTSEPSRVGDVGDPSLVPEIDSIGSTNVVARLNQGLDVGGQPIGTPTAFHLGVRPMVRGLQVAISRDRLDAARVVAGPVRG